MPYRLAVVILALALFAGFVLGGLPDFRQPTSSTPEPNFTAAPRTTPIRVAGPVGTLHSKTAVPHRPAAPAELPTARAPGVGRVDVQFPGFQPNEPLVLAWEDSQGNPGRTWSDLDARVTLHDVPAGAGRLVLRHGFPHEALRFDEQTIDVDAATKLSAELRWPEPIETESGGLDLTVALHEEAAELQTRVELSIVVVPHEDTEAQRRRRGADRASPLSQFSMLGAGRFWTRLSGLEPGSYRVFVERLGFAVDVVIEPGLTSTAELVCGPLAHVLVQVVDATGRAAAPDSLLARAWPAGFEPLQDGRLWRRTRLIDHEDGLFELVCAPGKLQVDLSSHGGVHRRIEEVTAGWNDLRVECPRSYGVSLELPDSMSPAEIDRLEIRTPAGAHVVSRGVGRRLSPGSATDSVPLLRFSVSHPGTYVVNAGSHDKDPAWTLEVSAAEAVLVLSEPH